MRLLAILVLAAGAPAALALLGSEPRDARNQTPLEDLRGGDQIQNATCQVVGCSSLVVSSDDCTRCTGGFQHMCVRAPSPNVCTSTGASGCGNQVQCNKFAFHEQDCVWVQSTECNWNDCVPTQNPCPGFSC